MFERHTFNGATLVEAVKEFYSALAGDLAKANVSDVTFSQHSGGWTVVAFVYVTVPGGKSE